MNRNVGYVTRQVNYFFGRAGHVFVLVFVAETIPVTDRSQLQLVERVDFVGLVSKGPATEWGGIVPRIDGDGARYVGREATVEDAVEAVRAEAAALRAEADRCAADPAYAAEQLLKTHDWYAHYSDDYGVCAASDRHWEKIQALLKQLPEADAAALVAKYQPKVK